VSIGKVNFTEVGTRVGRLHQLHSDN
jgi:hypothetical protein